MIRDCYEYWSDEDFHSELLESLSEQVVMINNNPFARLDVVILHET